MEGVYFQGLDLFRDAYMGLRGEINRYKCGKAEMLSDQTKAIWRAGQVANGVNALWYLYEGDYVNARISGVSILPLFGDAAKGLDI